MSYVNITGVNIGTCLTGFGIHFPVTISNSGNSEVFYTLNNSNVTNFDLSKDSFVISANDYTIFDILYNPTISSPSSNEETLITISSTSVEDGSTDPSGNISLYITGTKIIDITGGNPRSFRAISNPVGPSYDFYWKAPTGITGDNLHNYFITGYRLDLSTTTNFSSPDFTKYINVAKNNNIDPSYSTFYGFGDEDVFYRLSKNEFPSLKIDQNYYARLHSLVNNNSGVSIYASGVDSVSQSVSEEVFLGYSGTPINLKIEKKAFNFYISPDNIWFNYTYELFPKLIQANNGSADFSAYSGINIYLPENSVFESIDLKKGAINLDGKFINLSGNAATYINLYIPTSTSVLGRNGEGSNLFFEKNTTIFNGREGYTKNGGQPPDVITKCLNNSKVYLDTTNGGPAFTLKAATNINNIIYTDIKYNIYSKLSNPQIINQNTNTWTKIAGGPGGNKGGFIYFPYDSHGSTYFFIDTLDIDSTSTYQSFYLTVMPINGWQPYLYLLDRSRFRKWVYWLLGYRAVELGIPLPNRYDSTIESPIIGSGEMGIANIVYSKNGSRYYLNENRYRIQPEKINLEYNQTWGYNGYYAFTDRAVFYPIDIKTNNRLPGKIVDTFSDSSVSFNLYNNLLPSDFIFRFTQAGLSSATSWTGGSYTLTSTNSGSYIANYKNLGYKALNLKNNKDIKIDFPSNTLINCSTFDLFFICSFDSFTDPTLNQYLYADLFHWYKTSNPNNITNNQFSIKAHDPLIYNPYSKENIMFNYKNSCLQNKLDNTKDTSLSSDINFNWRKLLSKQLNTLLEISNISSNVITTTTNHNLENGDIIGFSGTSIPNGVKEYDLTAPLGYTKFLYYIKNKTASTFQISSSSGGSALSISGGTGNIIYKLKSDNLYKPFIMQVRRIENNYFYYINRHLINQYSANISDNNLINNLQSTTFKLNNSSSIGINYFDCCFYNRLLNSTELDSTYSYFVNSYLSLFAGEASITSLDLKSNLYSYRIPNIFQLAGKV